MVVIAIVGILTAVAGSYMRTPRDERALGAAANAMTSLLSQSRNRAMSTGNAVIMRIEGHKPARDMVTGDAVGKGTRFSRVEVFDSLTANCGDRAPAPIVQRVMNPSAPELPYRHTVMTRVEPSNAQSVTTICFTPTGRVVDPVTSRPLNNIGSSAFGGRLLIEFRPMNCRGLDCEARPDRVTISLGFNGLVERMATDFDMGTLL